MEKIKRSIHSEVNKIGSKSVSPIDATNIIQSETDFLITQAYHESLYVEDLATPEDIGKVIFKLRFSLATEKHSEKEWEMINSLYIEALSDKRKVDLLEVCKDYIQGRRGKFMPKPAELAEACLDEADYRHQTGALIRWAMGKSDKYKPEYEKLNDNSDQGNAMKRLLPPYLY